jgi:hypothetical protein
MTSVAKALGGVVDCWTSSRWPSTRGGSRPSWPAPAPPATSARPRTPSPCAARHPTWPRRPTGRTGRRLRSPDRCGSPPPGCDLRGLRSNGRCRLRPTRGESPGANAERLASTPRQPRPIADPVRQGTWLGILNGLPLGACGVWTHDPASRSNRRTTCVSEGFRHRTGLTRRRCCSRDVRRPPFITSTLLPAAPTAPQ